MCKFLKISEYASICSEILSGLLIGRYEINAKIYFNMNINLIILMRSSMAKRSVLENVDEYISSRSSIAARLVRSACDRGS
jgi:hypothetical protein